MASRYSAFISYSHADQAVARWLHRALETYALPKALIGAPSPFGPVPRRLPPVFRDRDELPASGDLGQELLAALAATRFQIVLCSPRAAASKWVNEEILSFKRLHGEGRVLAVIVDGEPYSGGDTECFPPALRFRLAPDGSLSDTPAEPIAADLRPGKDGRRLALLKLIAGVTGLPLDALAQRDAARRQQRLLFVAAGAVAAAVTTGGLAIYANVERVAADHQRLLADKSLDFLVGTFAIANPATENPRTITALTILDRVSKRAAGELANEPAVSARLLSTTGDIYFNLGLPKESERDLRAALALSPGAGEMRAKIFLKLAAIAWARGDSKTSKSLVDAASRAYDHNAGYARALDAEILERRGAIAFLEGRYTDAAAILDRAAEAYLHLPGDHREDIARLDMQAGRALVGAKAFNNADQRFSKAELEYARRFGHQHLLYAKALQDRALGMFEAGRLGEAGPKMDAALKIYQTVLEGDHPVIAAAYVMSGRIREARGDSAGASTAFSAARTIFIHLYGANNPAVADAEFYLAQAEADQQHIDEALRLLMDTKRIYDASYGPIDPDQVELLTARMKVYRAAHRMGEARSECAAAVALQAKIDPRSPELVAMHADCAALNASTIYAKKLH